MEQFSADIYREPSPIDVNTLANLGPLTTLAGIWQGDTGHDVKPKADGPREQAFVERMELQPIDPQTNGPQLLYGLRYHTHIVKPGQIKTYHEQVGYWLWEPASGTVIHTLSIPRGVNVLASAHVAADARRFELLATRDGQGGITAVPFLEHAFRITEFRICVEIESNDIWSYSEDTVMQIRGRDEPFHHTDRNRLVRIGEAMPNPLAR
ncbi:FABP family protein [Burkholderiaceae bacterium DAT-1]|nr:FABP family protein [Burkholderiaceae bacterium DAT-1]